MFTCRIMHKLFMFHRGKEIIYWIYSTLPTLNLQVSLVTPERQAQQKIPVNLCTNPRCVSLPQPSIRTKHGVHCCSTQLLKTETTNLVKLKTSTCCKLELYTWATVNEFFFFRSTKQNYEQKPELPERRKSLDLEKITLILAIQKYKENKREYVENKKSELRSVEIIQILDWGMSIH